MKRIGTLVAGGGPAAFALLLAARRQGRLRELLDAGLHIVEKSEATGSGALGNFGIRSDSHADSFIASAASLGEPSFQDAFAGEHGAAMERSAGSPVPLELAARFLKSLASRLTTWASSQGHSIVSTCVTATRARQSADGSWTTTCVDTSGVERTVQSDHLVIATGAQESTAALHDGVAGISVLPQHGAKIILSGELLHHTASERVDHRLDACAHPRIVIIGGSHSAISSAHRLLLSRHARRFQDSAITVLHRRPPRLTYASPEAARVEGYFDFKSEDICPRTGRVYPLAGFRNDARGVVHQALGLAGATPDCRLRFIRVGDTDGRLIAQLLHEADLIVSAVGYRPRALPLIDDDGRKIQLLCESAPGRALVDERSRVLDQDGRPVPGVFGIGLSSGFPLAGRFGESSFVGQANGLSLWQSTIGEELVSQLLSPTVMRNHLAYE